MLKSAKIMRIDKAEDNTVAFVTRRRACMVRGEKRS